MLLLSEQYDLAKMRANERQRLEDILSRQEARIRDAFKIFLTDARSPALLREARNLLDAHDVNGALELVTQHAVPLGRALSQAFVDAATAEGEALAAKHVGKAVTPRPRLGFDPGNARAADLMRTASLQFIQQFSANQVDATRTALVDAAARGLGPTATANSFKDSIGLTKAQVDAVNNYRNLLQAGSADALDRQLRDKRFDSRVERAVLNDQPLSNAQINTMVDRYQENMIAARAETIARTEGLSVTSAAREEAAQQIADQAGFDNTARTWNATQDNRTRDSHAALDGQTVGMDEPFVTDDGTEIMYPGDPDAPADERINCRCHVTYDFA